MELAFIDLGYALTNISTFRGLVIFLSFIFLAHLFWLKRRRLISIGSFALSILLTSCLLTLSAFPELTSRITYFVNLNTDTRFDRLFVLTFSSIIALFIMIFHTHNIARARALKLERMYLSMIVTNFLSQPDLTLTRCTFLILIPAYNEENSIADIIRRIPNSLSDHDVQILVISDGSHDATAPKALGLGVPVVQLPINCGQAVAYRVGYEIAIRMGYKFVLHLDADGQYRPEELHLVSDPLVKGEADFVSGSRLKGNYEEHLKYGNITRTVGVYVFNLILTLITSHKISDSASGFRGISVSLLKKLQLEQQQFHSSELLIEAIKKGAIYKEVGVTFESRLAGASKKPSTLKYGVGFAKAIIRTWYRN